MNVATTSFEAIEVDVVDHVCRLTLNRPDALNAFDEVMQEELRSVWRALRSDDDVHAGDANKAWIALTDSHYDRAHNKSSRQIIDHWREKETH